MKRSSIHDTSVPRQQTTKLVIETTASFGFGLFSTNVTKPYLQSAYNLMPYVFIDLHIQFILIPDQLIHLPKHLFKPYERDQVTTTRAEHCKSIFKISLE